jgi:pheromone shutdown protein TraB
LSDLTARQSALLTRGHTANEAFLGGYRAGLIVAAVLVAAGGFAAYVGLRASRPSDRNSLTEPVAELVSA